VTTGLTYSQYVTQIATMGAVASETDPNFVTILPQMITYAENRIYRELNFLQTSDSVTGYAIASGARTLTLPQGTFVVSEQINIITPAGTTDPEVGIRVPLLPVTKEYLDAVYGASTYTGQPKYFCPFNDNLFLVGPFADAQYYTEVVGEIRPDSLSATNTTTFISLYLPDLFIMASMIYLSAFQRNFGRMSDDPQMAQSYEAQYQLLKQGAQVEEARKSFEAGGWTSQAPATVASPSRG
jgi:hypothetical protein